MIRLFSMAVLLLLGLTSCSKDEQGRTYTYTPVIPTTPSGNDTTGTRSYLALGDSYTIGQSVPEKDRFPVQTVEFLDQAGIKFQAAEIIARTGWTTGNLLSTLATAPPQKASYDIVTLLIGVNNQYQHRTQQEYRAEFTTLLNMAIQYAGNNKKRVIVLSIPDYSVTPFANPSDKAQIAREIDEFNAINKSISAQAGVNYLDITGDSREAFDDPTLIAGDGLHPSGLEYKIWANALLPLIKEALK